MTTTLEAIQAKMKKLQAQADALATKKSATVLKTIYELMDKHGLTIADIDTAVRGKQRTKQSVAKTGVKKSAAAAKYHNPKTGATWSGHGRAPGWIATAKNRDRFLVDGATATATAKPVSAGKAKAAIKKASKLVGQGAGKGQPKGPLPALYLDPKTGATWSGRGRAPAWLAGARDRTKYLVAGAGAGEAGAEPKPAAAKKAPAKKAAAKKSPTKKAVVKKVAAKKGMPIAKKAAAKKAPSKKAAVKKAVVKKVVAKKPAASSAAPTQAPAKADDAAGATAIA